MQRRKLEELNLLDDFLFNAMLAYPDTGEAFIRKLLETLFERRPGCCTPGVKKETFRKVCVSCSATWRTRTRTMRSMKI